MGEYRRPSARPRGDRSRFRTGGRDMQTEDAIARQTAGSVAWLELFYDLVFVSAVVTFSDAISFRPDLGRIGAVDAAFGAMWLVWIATTLHANRYRDDGAVQRALVLAQM